MDASLWLEEGKECAIDSSEELVMLWKSLDWKVFRGSLYAIPRIPEVKSNPHVMEVEIVYVSSFKLLKSNYRTLGLACLRHIASPASNIFVEIRLRG